MQGNDYFIFDMDGTLFDTLGDLQVAANESFEKFGLKPVDRSTLIEYLGSGDIRVLQNYQSFFDDEKTKIIFKHYFQSYVQNCCVHTEFFPGVKELLKKTFRAALLTNKHSIPTQIILEHFGLSGRFEIILCSDTSPAPKPSPAGILRILEMAGIPLEHAIMVGDDVPDIRAAKAAGIRSIGLLNGYGNKERLKFEKPDILLESMVDFPR